MQRGDEIAWAHAPLGGDSARGGAEGELFGENGDELGKMIQKPRAGKIEAKHVVVKGARPVTDE